MKNYSLEIVPYFLDKTKGKLFIMSEKMIFFRHKNQTSFSWFEVDATKKNELIKRAESYYLEYYHNDNTEEDNKEYFLDDIEGYELKASSIEEACNIALQDF